MLDTLDEKTILRALMMVCRENTDEAIMWLDAAKREKGGDDKTSQERRDELVQTQVQVLIQAYHPNK